ncbi:TonB family protein [Myxococcaceae bacterium GXIMD 01537]
MTNGDGPNPESPPADPLIGRTLNGRFSVMEPLGVGGMGKVYRALQAPLDRMVALKVLNPSFPSARDPGFQKRFLREASLTSKLRHPNTVTVIDYGQTDDGIYYIAMEYLEGRTLAQALGQQGPLPWSRAVSIAQQVCRSLREAHSMGIVHRDLKPANIMLLNEADQDLVKVLDFGLVKSMAAPAPEVAPSPEITQNGTFLGSPQYMAPEQARNVSDARSDVYSLGIVLYQMLMGRPPFISRDHIELIFSHYKEAPPTFAQVRPDLPVPPELEAVVRRCLEKDPARRYQTMDELLEGLREATASAGGHSGIFKRPGGANTTGPYPSPLFASVAAPADQTLAVDISVEVPPAVSRAHKRKLGVIGLASALVAIGTGAGAFLALSKGQGEETAPTAPVAAATAPAAETKPAEPAEPPPPPGTQMVRLRLMSQPTGARVFYKGKERGLTPFVLEIPPGADGTVTAELTFALEGYQTETVITGGSGEVVLSQKLQKRRVGAGGRVEVATAGGEDLSPAESVMAASVSMPVRMDAAPAPTPSAPVKGASGAPLPGEIAAAAAAPAYGSIGVPQLPVGVRPATNGPMPFMEGMDRPEQLEGKDIVYTREALAAKVQGQMLVKCTITVQGRVENCRVLKSLPHMEQPVVESLRSRVYKPIVYQGKPVAVDYVFNIRLVLPRR